MSNRVEWWLRMIVAIALGALATELDWDVITFRNFPHVTWGNDLGLFVLLAATAMLPVRRKRR